MADLLTDEPADNSPAPGPRAPGANHESDRPNGRPERPAPVGDGRPPARAPLSRNMDVWSRTEPKYRIRAAFLLVINFLLFSGLCIFTHWLQFARPFDFSWISYLEPFQFWGEQTYNLNRLLTSPINVTEVPVHGVVLGLLLASIIAVPPVVAMLYRLPCSLPFVAAVFVFAHFPWMAITLLGGCILATVRPFRLSFRFGSALLALVPVLLYFFMATRGPADELSVRGAPSQKAFQAVPFILAILAASVMMALMLLIARIVNYRPGAVAPVMAIMLAPPIVLFARSVGPDEVAYRVLERDYGPHSPRFEPVQDATPRIRELMQRYDPARSEVLAVWGGEVASLKRRVSRRIELDVLADRRAAYVACKRFIAEHPSSRYVQNALYIQGRAMDTRLDLRRLREAGSRELYTDFPHMQSEEAWTALLRQHPDSPLATVAGLRLAQLRLRSGKVDDAVEFLRAAPRRDANLLPAPNAAQPAIGDLLRAPPPETSLRFESDPLLFEARRLRELIEHNRDDPHYGNTPLAELATLDPRRPRYPEQLLALAERFSGSRLYDNLLVFWASALPDPQQRAQQLADCIRAFPDGDAAPEALFRLADLEIQTLGMDRPESRQAGVARMQIIVAQHPDTCWGLAARERLHLVQPLTTAPTTAATEVSAP